MEDHVHVPSSAFKWELWWESSTSRSSAPLMLHPTRIKYFNTCILTFYADTNQIATFLICALMTNSMSIYEHKLSLVLFMFDSSDLILRIYLHSYNFIRFWPDTLTPSSNLKVPSNLMHLFVGGELEDQLGGQCGLSAVGLPQPGPDSQPRCVTLPKFRRQWWEYGGKLQSKVCPNVRNCMEKKRSI